MRHYLEMMRHFLQAEQRVLETYLQGSSRGKAAGNQAAVYSAVGPDNQSGPFPLLGEILSLVRGQSLLARRRIDPDEDLYLHDHTFGGAMSVTDTSLEPLYVAPLTISLELMAEAATVVLPGLLLTGMADIRAHRWVQVDEIGPTLLEITAQRCDGPEHRVRVEVREVDGDGAAGAMVIEGTMLFGVAYETAPRPQSFMPTTPRATVKTAAQMYSEQWMFHGPLFQGVASLDVSGDDGIIGTLDVLPTGKLFRSAGRPHLLTDVALLDAAGQLLGYWAKERLDTNFIVFPIRVAAIHIYRPNLPAGRSVRCHVKITELMPQTVKVDMEILDDQGRVWMHVDGWQDWRFDIVGDLYDFWRFPIRTVMSTPFPAPLPARPETGTATCYRMGRLTGLEQAMVIKSLAYMALTHAERRLYHSLHGMDKRHVEWLIGRIAAKDAVRVYLRQRHGMQLGLGDIEIAADSHGRPIARGIWEQSARAPKISLTHVDGIGLALAADAPDVIGIGIDLQQITARDAAFEAIAFTPQELALLQGLAGEARNQRCTEFWCAKEAVAKALGLGLLEGPQAVVIESWNGATGTALVALRGALAARFPHLEGHKLAAYTVRDGNYIVATSFGERV